MEWGKGGKIVGSIVTCPDDCKVSYVDALSSVSTPERLANPLMLHMSRHNTG